MDILIRILINTLAVFFTAYILPGVKVDSFWQALLVAVVLGIINIFIKPILVFFTLPITILTMGLFLLVVNALLILLAAQIVPGFYVNGFWWALLFSLIFSIFKIILDKVFGV